MTKIAFDTETHGFDWFDDQLAFLGSWADADNEYVARLGEPDGVQEYMNAIKMGEPLVAHNFAFDCHQTRETLDYDLLQRGGTFDDTEIMARIAIPTGQRKGSYKLKDLAATFVDPDAKKYEEHMLELMKELGIKKDSPGAYYEVWRAYPDVVEKYAKMDARQTYDLHTKFEDELVDNVAYELEREVMPVLIKAEERGIRLDPSVVERLKKEYELKAEEAYEPLVAALGEKALGGKGSEQALLDALLGIGVPLYRKSKKSGKLSTDKFALQEFENQFPVLRQLMDWRQYEKFLSTYIGAMDGREVVHTSFRQCEAWTGRMSSARPNMQNIPKRAGKEVREMFIPREDHVFVVFDYESIEVRLLAYYMASERYRTLIREGRDPHAYMASCIHGGSYEDYLKGTDGQPMRDIAKHTMFAITYGAGAPRVADMNKISKAEARELIKMIKKSLPGYYRLNSKIRKKIETVGYVETGLGRRRQVVDKSKSYVGLNSLIQGTAAEIMKKGLVQVNDLVAPLGATPLLVVHDELVVEAPIEVAEEVKALMPDALNSAFDMDPPLAVEGGIVTTNYAEA